MGIASEWLTGHPGNLSELQADNYMSDMCVLSLFRGWGDKLAKGQDERDRREPLRFSFLS